ncbi:MAG: iron-sulfur cluster insertion protein ErpA [Alphaproteobacteria bacterium]|nr:iron-sulfur cluster insertion protein ErpA [Alphaproteobacteria bacterium]MCK5622331.1 iron-sulfur cluster insertion protein ErpA [Alphaproteobacteria bacterium]
MTDIFADGTTADDRNFTVSDSAVKRIAWLIEQEEGDALFLRVSVSGGGCSGFQYGFTFDDEIRAEDHSFERDGVKVVVDETSLDLMGGAEIDFVEDLIGASFQIRNPMATASCGCGSSFSV